MIDTTEQYIKMCNCEEIRNSWNPRIGDWVLPLNKKADGRDSKTHFSDLHIVLGCYGSVEGLQKETWNKTEDAER